MEAKTSALFHKKEQVLSSSQKIDLEEDTQKDAQTKSPFLENYYPYFLSRPRKREYPGVTSSVNIIDDEDIASLKSRIQKEIDKNSEKLNSLKNLLAKLNSGVQNVSMRVSPLANPLLSLTDKTKCRTSSASLQDGCGKSCYPIQPDEVNKINIDAEENIEELRKKRPRSGFVMQRLDSCDSISSHANESFASESTNSTLTRRNSPRPINLLTAAIRDKELLEKDSFLAPCEIIQCMKPNSNDSIIDSTENTNGASAHLL